MPPVPLLTLSLLLLLYFASYSNNVLLPLDSRDALSRIKWTVRDKRRVRGAPGKNEIIPA